MLTDIYMSVGDDLWPTEMKMIENEQDDEDENKNEDDDSN